MKQLLLIISIPIFLLVLVALVVMVTESDTLQKWDKGLDDKQATNKAAQHNKLMYGATNHCESLWRISYKVSQNYPLSKLDKEYLQNLEEQNRTYENVPHYEECKGCLFKKIRGNFPSNILNENHSAIDSMIEDGDNFNQIKKEIEKEQ